MMEESKGSIQDVTAVGRSPKVATRRMRGSYTRCGDAKKTRPRSRALQGSCSGLDAPPAAAALFTHITTTRMTKGDGLNQRNGLAGLGVTAS